MGPAWVQLHSVQQCLFLSPEHHLLWGFLCNRGGSPHISLANLLVVPFWLSFSVTTQYSYHKHNQCSSFPDHPPLLAGLLVLMWWSTAFSGAISKASCRILSSWFPELWVIFIPSTPTASTPYFSVPCYMRGSFLGASAVLLVFILSQSPLSILVVSARRWSYLACSNCCFPITSTQLSREDEDMKLP